MTTPTHFTGGCLCGGIRFHIDGPLAPIQVCHCGQCRKAQGAPFATNIPVARTALHVERGEALLKSFESSPGKRRHFCGHCGSPLFSERDSDPTVVRLRAGLLDGPLPVGLEFHAFVASKANWWPLNDGLPQHDGFAPVPPKTD